jgi:uncharacterized protein with PIN domain
MGLVLSDAFMEDVNTKIKNHEILIVTTSNNIVIRYVMRNLILNSIPYKLYNLGAGLKTITTDTNICPCCKRELNLKTKQEIAL